jgi:hypothetical protein
LNESQATEKKKPPVITEGYDFLGGGGGSRTLKNQMISNDYP